MGNVFTKDDEWDLLGLREFTKYRSGVVKLMHVMQYPSPQIYNAVQDLARHMTKPAPKHMKEMLHCMKHMADRPNRGLVLAPTWLWDGSNDFKFRVSGNSDSDYAKEPVDRRIVFGSVIKLEGGPVVFLQ